VAQADLEAEDQLLLVDQLVLLVVVLADKELKMLYQVVAVAVADLLQQTVADSLQQGLVELVELVELVAQVVLVVLVQPQEL
jgi:hypothetical protein